MLPIEQSRAKRAKTYTKIREAFGLDDDYPSSSVDSAKDAIAELISDHTDGVGTPLSYWVATAEKALVHRDNVAGLAPAKWDIASLAEAVGSKTSAILIARLCGAYAQDANWIDDGEGRPVFVSFESWNSN